METNEDKINEKTESDIATTENVDGNEETIKETTERTEETSENGNEESEIESTEGSESSAIEYIVSVDSNDKFNTPINELPFSSVMLVIGVFVIALTLLGGFKHE